MSVDDSALDDCERKFYAAVRLAIMATDVLTVLAELTKLLEVTAGNDPGFIAEEASGDASRDAADARRHVRSIKRIAEARENDLREEIRELRAAENAGSVGA